MGTNIFFRRSFRRLITSIRGRKASKDFPQSPVWTFCSKRLRVCSAHHLVGATIESVLVSVSKMINALFHRISPLNLSDSGNVEEMMDFVKEKLTTPFCQSMIVPYTIVQKTPSSVCV